MTSCSFCRPKISSSFPFRAGAWFFLLLILVPAGPVWPAARKEKMMEARLLAQALPLSWMGMNLLADKQFGNRKVAQLEITYARADYVSNDDQEEVAIEIMDTIHSPMHRNEYAAEARKHDPSRLRPWISQGVAGYIVQDGAENESRVRLLILDRYYVSINQSPRASYDDLAIELERWLVSERFTNVFTLPPVKK